MSPTLLFSVGLLLLLAALVSAAISALETALISIKEHHVAIIGDRHPELTGMMKAIARQPQRSLQQALILSTLANLALAVLGLLLIREFPPLISGRPFLSAALLFGLIILLTELIPTVAALVAPAQVFRFLIIPFIRVSPALEGLSIRLESLAASAGKRLLPASFQLRDALTDDEVETLVEMRRQKGVLAEDESEMIQEIIRLGNKTVKDCLTPRVDTFMVSDSDDSPEILRRLWESSRWYWHLPVYQDSPDTIIGTLDVRSWLFDGAGDLSPWIRPPVFLPETMNALEAFQDYLARPRTLCIVLDEYGGVEGVLAHGDLVEEFLWNAAPTEVQEENFELLFPGLVRADGDARLDDLGEFLGIPMERDGIDTIGGLVFNELGRVPRPRTIVRFDGFDVEVRTCRHQRITGVEIRTPQVPEVSPG